MFLIQPSENRKRKYRVREQLFLIYSMVHTISHRVARYLDRQSVLERDEENSYLQLDGIDEDQMQQLIGYSVSYQIAVGPQNRSVGCSPKLGALGDIDPNAAR